MTFFVLWENFRYKRFERCFKVLFDMVVASEKGIFTLMLQ